VIREYHLTSEREDFFTLMFDENGRMFVEIYRDYEQPHKKPISTYVQPEEFEKYTVGEISLKEVVVKKLQEILPPTPAPPDVHLQIEQLMKRQA
jgi:hypothetical protein